MNISLPLSLWDPPRVMGQAPLTAQSR